MTAHAHPLKAGRRPQREEPFLIDGCARCAEYARDLGLPFDQKRWQAFWAKMIAVELDDVGGYASQLDKELGRKLYYVALTIQRGAGFDPRIFALTSPSFVAVAKASLEALTERAANARSVTGDPSALDELDAVIDGLRALSRLPD